MSQYIQYKLKILTITFIKNQSNFNQSSQSFSTSVIILDILINDPFICL